MRNNLDKALILFAFLLASLGASSHPGRTDSDGGHYNRKTKTYHYHSGSAPVPASVIEPVQAPAISFPAFKGSGNMAEGGFLINGKTYVPLRFVAEKLGAQVAWDSETKTAIISSPGSSEPIMVRVSKR